MDLAYWGFAHWPFQSRRHGNLSPHGAAQDEAFARLLFLIDERRQVGVLTGAAGTGKSCLLQLAKTYSQRHGHRSLVINATGMGASDFAESIADGTLGGDEIDAAPSRCWSRIQQELRALALINQPATILIDHFDLAAEPLAASVRRLSHLSAQAEAELTILIAARDLKPASDLRDEVDLCVELTGWSAHETSQFIGDRLKAAGASTTIFLPDAVGHVHALTGGNPAQVIRICDLALLATMNDGLHQVDATIVEAAVAELSPFRAGATSPVIPHQRVDAKILV